MTRLVRDGPRRALLWLSDWLMGSLTTRNREPRRLDVREAEIHTMPTDDEARASLRLFSQWFEYPSEVRVLRRLAQRFPWASIVLLHRGEVCGYSFFRILPGKRAILVSMAVDPRLRGRGLGRSMLTFALKILREKGVAEVELDVERENEAAVRLYQSEGFDVTGPPLEGKPLRMRRVL